MGPYSESDYYRIEDRGYENTILIFSSIHTVPGRFRFDRLMGKIPANIIYLNCVNNSWYLCGIPGLGDDLPTTRKNLQKLIRDRLPGTKLFAFGSSMGASGMIAMSSELELENAFAFCPEIDLFGKGSFSGNYFKNYSGDKKDLWDEFLSIKNISIFYGEECENDLAQLIRIKERADCPITTIAFEPHGVIEAVCLTEGIEGIIDALLNKKSFNPKILQKGHIAGSKITGNLISKAYKANNNEKPQILIQIRELSEKTKKDRSYYPLLKYWQARLSADPDEKRNSIREAMSLAPSSLRIAQLYFTLNKSVEEKEQFKSIWREKFGNKYADHSRAKILQEL
ncbi:hypothetical protein [Atlantibacter hermannii]|uniref:hypothetical protein n=1 Tax=Atlantibacter hermannii TaxID=565 RepID=UPI0028A7CF93|nr:hypothetical protein [Atlantibacter hermannii]MDU7391775.1 hypothetical protein [Atlantibacter hermannii]